MPTCARGFSLFGTDLVEKGSVFGFVACPWCLVHLGSTSFASNPPLCVQGLGFKDVHPAGHALRAEFGGGITFVAPGEFAGQHKILPVKIVMESVAFMFPSCICLLQRDGPVSRAMMHVWFIGFKGHPGEIAGKNKARPLFLLISFSV